MSAKARFRSGRNICSRANNLKGPLDMRDTIIAILARIQLWALNHKFPGSAALVCALDRVMGVLER